MFFSISTAGYDPDMKFYGGEDDAYDMLMMSSWVKNHWTGLVRRQAMLS